MPRAPVHPVFVDRETAAGLLMISTDTFDVWVSAGFIPAAHIKRGQIIRWHWPSLEERLAGADRQTQHDPSVSGVANVKKGRGRAAA